jgi:hypothetical protein
LLGLILLCSVSTAKTVPGSHPEMTFDEAKLIPTVYTEEGGIYGTFYLKNMPVFGYNNSAPAPTKFRDIKRVRVIYQDYTCNSYGCKGLGYDDVVAPVGIGIPSWSQQNNSFTLYFEKKAVSHIEKAWNKYGDLYTNTMYIVIVEDAFNRKFIQAFSSPWSDRP